MNKSQIEQQVKNWLYRFVLDFNLCPFAHQIVRDDKVNYKVTEADSDDSLLEALLSELQSLDNHPEIETSLLIHPNVLTDFNDYNQFLDRVDSLVTTQHYEGIYQIATFHPDYQFADTRPDDNENYSNRSPLPILHILREESLAEAVTKHPNPEAIPQQNIARLNSMNNAELKALLQSCFQID